ncbi:MAG: extracellular solute-binding protein [Desulfobacterales bacterium]|nr:extracellular solute-binding protein [Desulfobacterales bacterium]
MKREKLCFLSSATLFFLILFHAFPAMAQPAGEMDWKKTLTAAEEEKKVTIYGTASSSTREDLTREFSRKYGIQLEFVSGRGSQIFAKLSTERQAELYLADIYIGGATTPTTGFKPRGFLDPLKPLLVLPEVIDPTLWFGGKGLQFSDKEGQFVACPVLTASNNYLSINPDLVKPGEIKAYSDLLNPKWKGKIIMNDPTTSGAGSRWFAVVADQFMGLDFMRDLAKNEPVITRDQRLQAEGLARGKYAVALGVQPDIQAEFIAAGARVKTVIPTEGAWLGGGPGLIAYMNRAPHPNAAKIFINWFVSKEGQTVYSRSARAESARLDVPTDHLFKEDLRVPGVKYFNSEAEDFLIKKREYEKKWAKEIFGSLSTGAKKKKKK